MQPAAKLCSIAMLFGAWAIFSLWGVIARSITLPVPILLLIICIGGAVFSLFFVERPIKLDRLAIVVALVLVCDLLLLFLAFQRVTFATAIAVHYAGPIIVALCAPYFLNERFSVYGLSLAVVGFAAVVTLCGVERDFGRRPESIAGIMFAFASAFTLAGNIIFQRKYMTLHASYGNAVFQYNMFMVIGLVPAVTLWSALTPGPLIPLPADAVWQIILAFVAGLLTQGIAMILFNAAIRRVDSQTVSRMAFSEVAMVIVLGAIIYGESVTFIQGVAVVAIGWVVYLSISAPRSDKR